MIRLFSVLSFILIMYLFVMREGSRFIVNISLVISTLDVGRWWLRDRNFEHGIGSYFQSLIPPNPISFHK